MSTFRTIILGLIALITVGFCYFFSKDGSMAKLLKRGEFIEGEPLFSYSPTKARWIRIKNGDKEAEFYLNNNEVWWASKPWKDRVDPRAIQAILQFSLGSRLVDQVPVPKNSEELRAFGLNESTEIVIKDKKERSLARFSLGNTAPWIIEEKKPVKKGGIEQESIQKIPTQYLTTDLYRWMDNIFVMSGDIKPLFKDGLRNLRDVRPFYFDQTQLTAIDINNAGNKVTLNYDKTSNKWKLASPISLKTNPTMVHALINGLQTISATRILNKNEVSLVNPDSSQNITITLKFKKHAPTTLTLYTAEQSTPGTIIASVSDRTCYFELPLKNADGIPGLNNIPLTQSLLRSRQLAYIPAKDLRAASIYNATLKQNILLKPINQNNWGYSVNNDEFEPINEEQFLDLIKTLMVKPVEDFATDSALELAPYGLENPAFTLTFDLGKEEPIIINIGVGVNDIFYANVLGSPSVYILSSEYVNKLGLYAYKWKARTLVLFNSSELKTINIDLLDKNGQAKSQLGLKYNYMEDEWSAAFNNKDISTELNPNKANNYLDHLAKLNVKQWLGGDHLPAYKALQHPIAKISLTTEPTIPVAGFTTVRDCIYFAPVSQEFNTGFFYGQREGEDDYFIIEGSELLPILNPDLLENDSDDR